MGTFPNNIDIDVKNLPISTVVFGNRFRADQTMYEYLIEFLLVFSSAKSDDLSTGKYMFHDLSHGEILSYWVEPRMGLRRFIFFDKTKKNGSVPADDMAYKEMIRLLKSKMDVPEEKKDEYIHSIQDLFHGYAVVIKNRFWGAQALLPICPEFMLCGCDPSLKKRKKEVRWDEDTRSSVDTKFSFDKRNFLARGGEVYYLHLLQGLQNNDEKKKRLERLLSYLVRVQCSKISKMASFVENIWEEDLGEGKYAQKLNISYIPDNAYVDCEDYAIDELINFLSSNIDPINKVEILARGVMLQIMRMMSWRISSYLKQKNNRPWIIDMTKGKNGILKRIAANNFRDIGNDFMTVLNQEAEAMGIDKDQLTKNIRKARNDSWNIFKSKGKEMQLIIPSRGDFERFSISEEVARFLVLSLIKPGEKMTLDMFLEKLYRHYGMVIGPNEFYNIISDESLDSSLGDVFYENEIAFQNFLKATGFLTELSDATSVVVNPYKEVRNDNEIYS